MARFHINNNGDAGTCRASSGGCPFGGEADHYDTAEEARAAFEQEMGGAFQKMTREEAAEIAEALTQRFKQYVSLRADLDRHRAERNKPAFDATVKQLRYYEARGWHGATLKERYPALYQRTCRGIAAQREAQAVPVAAGVGAAASAPQERKRLTVPKMEPLRRPEPAAPPAPPKTPKPVAAPPKPAPVASEPVEKKGMLSKLVERVRHPYGPRTKKEEAPTLARAPKGNSGPDPEFIEALRKMYVAKFGTQPEDDGVDTGTLLAMFNKGELG